MPNEIEIDPYYNHSYCKPCDRNFNTVNGLLSHCRTARVHAGEWCERCEQLFVNENALISHSENSSQHHICSTCDLDFECSSDLNSHNAVEHLPRRGNAVVRRNYTSSQPVSSFLSCSFLLTFLQQQRIYHYHDNECFGCYEQFATQSGMLMHLESGACESRTELHDIDDWAFRGSESYEYTNGWGDYYKYRCPTCDDDFRVVSALIQHIEERDCGQRLKGSVRRMLDYIEDKVLG